MVGVVLVGWLAYSLKEIVVLLVVGYCISYAIEPIVSYFERKHEVPRPRGVMLVAVIGIIIFLLLLITALPPLIREGRSLAENLPQYTETVRGKLEPLIERVVSDKDGPLYEIAKSPLNLLKAVGQNLLPRFFSGLATVLLGGYSVTLTLINLALLPFIVFYLSVDFPRMRMAFLKLFPYSRRGRVGEVLDEIDGYTSSFVRGQVLVCTVLFGLYAVGLWLLGVELWFLLAFIAGYGNIIPYLGFLVGIALSTIMTIVTFGSFTQVLIVWGLFGLVQFLEGSFITPKIIGSSVGLSPLAVILAIVAGGTLFGLIGIFLAVPGAAVLKVLLRHLYDWALRNS